MVTAAVETKRVRCRLCVGACALEVQVNNGEIVKINSDRESNTKGFWCQRARLAALNFHNHPSRLNYPLKRSGTRGEGKWDRISWKQAMDEIADKIGDIRERYGPEAVASMAGEGIGMYRWIEQRWCNLFGTPNRFYSSMNCFSAGMIAEVAVYGSDTAHPLPVPGVTKCMAMFTANPYESRPHWWSKIIDAKEKGAKLIVVDPRLTKTGEVADLYLQIRPGTDAALAYGMLNVIIQEDLYDKEFVQKWCLGFDELKSSVREYTPETVEGITWIPREKIVEAARLYATNKPAQINSVWGVAHSHLGRDAVLAVNLAKCALRAITGNLDVEGADFMYGDIEKLNYDENMYWEKLINHPLRKRDSVSADRFPIASVKGFALFREALKKTFNKGGFIHDHILSPMVSPSLMWQAIVEEKPYPIKALFITGLNVMCTRTNPRRIYEALKSQNLELLVTMDLFMRPHGMLADYVLPAADWFEVEALGIYSYLATEQTVAPKFERRPDYYFWRELGIRLGQEDYWPETLNNMYDRLLVPVGLSFKEFARRTEEENRPIIPARRYRKYEERGFATFSGKVELVPSILRKLGYEIPPPSIEPPRSPVATPDLARTYPFILITGGKFRTFKQSTLREMEELRRLHPDPIVQLHPDTASEIGVSSGDWVYIETPEGKIKQKAEVTTRLHPRVVHIEHAWSFPEQAGQAPNLFGIWESNAGVILPDDPDMCDYQGGPPLRALLCKVSKA